MPKILQINATANWGSTGTIAEQCNQIAAKNGWETYFAYSRMQNASTSKIIKIGKKSDVLWAVMEARLLDYAGLSMRNATKVLIQKIVEIMPDIIHLHNIHGYVLNYQLLFEYLNQTNIQVVWTFHDFWAITGHCGHFVSANCMKWKTGCYACCLHKKYPSSFFDFSKRNYGLKKSLFSANKNLHIVAVSEWVGNHILESFLKDKNLRVIANGVDLTVFKPTLGFSHPKIKSNTFVILSVSSQWKNNSKGLSDYKEMSKLLKEDEVIVLVGLTDVIIEHLPDNIIGIHRTNNQQELAALYTRANVVTSFSRAETFGLTIVEGYACGTPAVVYNNTALPLLITPSTGFVVENKNYRQAYSAIQQIKLNGKSYYFLACIKLVLEKHSNEKCLLKYMELYEELIKK